MELLLKKDSEKIWVFWARYKAKKAKDFAKADEIRNQLTARGVIIIDTPNGPTWKRS